jgi:hypothetical protein
MLTLAGPTFLAYLTPNLFAIATFLKNLFSVRQCSAIPYSLTIADIAAQADPYPLTTRTNLTIAFF